MREKQQFFFSFKLVIFVQKLGKKEDILDWEWGLIWDPGDRRNGPGNYVCLFVFFFFFFFFW